MHLSKRILVFWISLGILLSLPNGVGAISLDRLRPDEAEEVRSILKVLDSLVEEKKHHGMAPLLTFNEIYNELDSGQIVFLEEICSLDPKLLNPENQKRPPPESAEKFIRVENQVITKNGKPCVLDAQYLPANVYNAYTHMMEAMRHDIGKQLFIESGYRSPAYQLYLFVYYLKNHDYSVRQTNRFVALPGSSEHGSPPFQAIDFISGDGISGEDHPEDFEKLPQYEWLTRHAGEYSFYLSYPKGGTSAFEPWHWHWQAQPPSPPSSHSPSSEHPSSQKSARGAS